MADSFIQLSPDSTGKKVDTRTAPDGDHREVQVIGSPTTADVAEADAANGLDVDVTRLPSIPAGTNNIGDVDIASLPDEGQQTMAASISVAIASDQSAVPVSGTVAVTGSATLAEQQTQTTHLAAIETAVELLDNAVAGTELQVDVVGPLPAGTNNIGDVDVLSSALPTGASTLAEQQTQTTHLATIAGDTTDIETAVELLDDTVATLGTSTYTEATTKGLVVGAVRRDADTTLVNTTNEVAPLQVDANGRLKVEVFSGETLPVSGTVAVTGAATEAKQDTQITHLAAIETAVEILDNAIAGTEMQVDVVAALPAGTNNIGDVDVLTLPALPAGTNNIGDVDIASVAAGTLIEVVGDVAADIAVPANPVIIGGRASTAQPTAVSADGDSVNMWTTRRGAPVVTAAPHIGIFNGEPWTLTGETAQYTTTQTSAVLVAGGASERLVVTKVQIQVGGTTAGTLQLYFGTGAYSRGTNLAIFDGEFAPSATLKPGVIMDGPFISAANGDDLLVTTSAAINPLTITVWYYVVV